jgi:hypothetical protein
MKLETFPDGSQLEWSDDRESVTVIAPVGVDPFDNDATKARVTKHRGGHSPHEEEPNVTNSNADDMPTRIAQIMGKLSESDAAMMKGFLQLLADELGKRDTSIAKSVLGRMADALDRNAEKLDKPTLAKLMLDTLTKSLRGETGLDDCPVDEATRKMMDADPEMEKLRMTVAVAVARARGEGLRKGNRPVDKLVAALDEYTELASEDLPGKNRQNVGVDQPPRSRRFMRGG